MWKVLRQTFIRFTSSNLHAHCSEPLFNPLEQPLLTKGCFVKSTPKRMLSQIATIGTFLYLRLTTIFYTHPRVLYSVTLYLNCPSCILQDEHHYKKNYSRLIWVRRVPYRTLNRTSLVYISICPTVNLLLAILDAGVRLRASAFGGRE